MGRGRYIPPRTADAYESERWIEASLRTACIAELPLTPYRLGRDARIWRDYGCWRRRRVCRERRRTRTAPLRRALATRDGFPPRSGTSTCMQTYIQPYRLTYMHNTIFGITPIHSNSLSALAVQKRKCSRPHSFGPAEHQGPWAVPPAAEGRRKEPGLGRGLRARRSVSSSRRNPSAAI
jgi:hypothetical protein